MRNLSYENDFCMQFYLQANQSHFDKNGSALRLALRQRHKVTRNWPVHESVLQCEFSRLCGGLLTVRDD